MLIQHCLKKVIIVWYDSHKEHHTLSLLQNTTSLAAVSTRKQCDCAVLIFSYINPRKRIIPVRNYRFITLSTELYEELITMICGLKQHGAAGKKNGDSVLFYRLWLANKSPGFTLSLHHPPPTSSQLIRVLYSSD